MSLIRDVKDNGGWIWGQWSEVDRFVCCPEVQPRCDWAGEWVNEMWYVYIMGIIQHSEKWTIKLHKNLHVSPESYTE